MYPEDFLYTKEHEWVQVREGIGTVGITDHAQHELGDIVYVDLPKVGAKLVKSKTLGSVESVKAVSDIYAPVSGEVIEVNSVLVDTPETLNGDAHGEGWLVKLRLDSTAELSGLLSAADYRSYIGE